MKWVNKNNKDAMSDKTLTVPGVFVLLSLLFLAFPVAHSVVMAECAVNGGCSEQYSSSGSSGSCSTDYAQLYCPDSMKYCDVTVTTCESQNFFIREMTCDCY